MLLTAGSNTLAITVEWAMSVLLNHPQDLKSARADLDKTIGQNHLLEEQDHPKLPYLQNIIYESQILYLSGCFLFHTNHQVIAP